MPLLPSEAHGSRAWPKKIGRDTASCARSTWCGCGILSPGRTSRTLAAKTRAGGVAASLPDGVTGVPSKRQGPRHPQRQREREALGHRQLLGDPRLPSVQPTGQPTALVTHCLGILAAYPARTHGTPPLLVWCANALTFRHSTTCSCNVIATTKR